MQKYLIPNNGILTIKDKTVKTPEKNLLCIPTPSNPVLFYIKLYHKNIKCKTFF